MAARRISRPPRAVNCPLCNGEFFNHSFPIHFKQCQKLHKETHIDCPTCGRSVYKCEWELHKENCTVALKNESSSKSDSLDPEDMLALSGKAPDHRIKCRFCHRKFDPERIEKHESICKKKHVKSDSPPKFDATPASKKAAAELKNLTLNNIDTNVKPWMNPRSASSFNAKDLKAMMKKKSIPKVVKDQSRPRTTKVRLNQRSAKLVSNFEKLPEDLQEQLAALAQSFRDLIEGKFDKPRGTFGKTK